MKNIKSRVTKFQEELPHLKYTEWEKFTIFDRNRRFSRKRYEYKLLWISSIGSQRQPIDPCRVSMTLSDPEMREVSGQIFWRISV